MVGPCRWQYQLLLWLVVAHAVGTGADVRHFGADEAQAERIRALTLETILLHTAHIVRRFLCLEP